MLWLNQSVENQNPENKSTKNNSRRIAQVLCGLFVALLLAQYFGAAKAEIKYWFNKNKDAKQILLHQPSQSQDNILTKELIVANNDEFALVIPKIGVNSRIIPNVDPFNSEIYLPALSKGIAHATGTSLPSDGGNTVLFAHSTDNFYNIYKYNAAFYLLSKLNTDDKVFVVQDKKIYEYIVLSNSIVSAKDMSYMTQDKKNTLTLITCWPAGTTLKRRVIVAKESKM